MKISLVVYVANYDRSINRWRAGAPRHDITVNLVNNLFQIFEFKIDHIEKSGWWIRFSGKYFQRPFEGFWVMSQEKEYRKSLWINVYGRIRCCIIFLISSPIKLSKFMVRALQNLDGLVHFRHSRIGGSWMQSWILCQSWHLGLGTNYGHHIDSSSQRRHSYGQRHRRN